MYTKYTTKQQPKKKTQSTINWNLLKFCNGYWEFAENTRIQCSSNDQIILWKLNKSIPLQNNPKLPIIIQWSMPVWFFSHILMDHIIGKRKNHSENPQIMKMNWNCFFFEFQSQLENTKKKANN